MKTSILASKNFRGMKVFSRFGLIPLVLILITLILSFAHYVKDEKTVIYNSTKHIKILETAKAADPTAPTPEPGKPDGASGNASCVKPKISVIPIPTTHGMVSCVDDLNEWLTLMFAFIADCIAAVAVLIIIFSGIKILTSGGDSGAVGDAKSMIMGSLIGLVLILVAALFIKMFGNGG